MSDQDALLKLDVLIEFFERYNNMISDIELRQEVQLAA